MELWPSGLRQRFTKPPKSNLPWVRIPQALPIKSDLMTKDDLIELIKIKPDGVSTRVKHSNLYYEILNITGKSLSEKIYNYVYNSKPRICGCGNETKFISLTLGYREFCSKTCSFYKNEIHKRAMITQEINGGIFLKNPKTKAKQQKTLFLHHQVTNPGQLEKTKEVIKASNLLNPYFSNNIDVRREAFAEFNGNPSYGHLTKDAIDKLNSKDWLTKKFKTANQYIIASELGVNVSTVLKKLNDFGIRNPNDWSTEKEILNFIRSLGFKAEKSKTILPIKENGYRNELDIVIEERKLAIEYCGLYWHSDKFKDMNYHKNKMLEANSVGYRLLTIFEDEWVNKRNICEDMIKSILGLQTNKIPARKTKIKLFEKSDREQIKQFFEKYHIQGFDGSSTLYLGLEFNSEIVAIMGFKKIGNNYSWTSNKIAWNLTRFASKGHIVGGASKLLKSFIGLYNPQIIVSFADLRWSEGALYEKLGFKRDIILRPDYSYCKGVERYHKFKFRKTGNKTEREESIEKGLFRIYDCGKIRFILDLKVDYCDN